MNTWHLVTSKAEIVLGFFYSQHVASAHDYAELVRIRKNIPVYVTSVDSKKMPKVGDPLSKYL